MKGLFFLLDNLWGAVKIAFFLITAPLSRLLYNRWGATAEEVRRPLPGDDIAPQPRMGYTRAVTIAAPPAAVWPWLIQLGQGRGGLYSYDGLENIAGCAMHSADRINPAWALQVGDTIDYGPPGKGYPGQTVVAIQPQQALITRFFDPKTREASGGSMVYVLADGGGGRTRLIARQRHIFEGGTGMSIMWHIVEAVNFVMEQKQLHGIKRRAERAWAAAGQRQAPAL